MTMQRRVDFEPSSDQRLSEFCEACATAFDRDPVECPRCDGERPETGWSSVAASSDPWLGRLVDGYQFRGRIGRGTAATVYRATSLHAPGRYAVKLIELENLLADDRRQARRQVRREVEVLSSVSSPHVVGFDDMFELPGETIAIVMEYIPGPTLADVLSEEGVFSVDRALSRSRDIAVGLGQAHERGAVHRDLKPENVMFRHPGDGREIAGVIDFGIVAFVSRPEEVEGFIGTPQYASPEQARSDPIDRRSDIYSLGSVLFHMVTGHLPFAYENSRHQLLAHSREETPTPTEQHPECGIPDSVEQLVLDMMAKDPDDRPGTMGDVVERTEGIIGRLSRATAAS